MFINEFKLDENNKEEVVRILNPLQVSKYMLQGVNPIGIFVDEITEKIVFVFKKSETRELYSKWLNREI